jgi:hypothetical protein
VVTLKFINTYPHQLKASRRRRATTSALRIAT